MGWCGAEDIFDSVAEVVLNNEFIKKRIGESARQTIVEKFSFEKIIEKELDLYKTI